MKSKSLRASFFFHMYLIISVRTRGVVIGFELCRPQWPNEAAEVIENSGGHLVGTEGASCRCPGGHKWWNRFLLVLFGNTFLKSQCQWHEIPIFYFNFSTWLSYIMFINIMWVIMWFFLIPIIVKRSVFTLIWINFFDLFTFCFFFRIINWFISVNRHKTLINFQTNYCCEG